MESQRVPPQGTEKTTGRWVAALVVVVAITMLFVGFHFAHTVRTSESIGTTATPTALSKKILPGSAVYSLDSVSDGSTSHTFGGSAHRTISVAFGKPVTIIGWTIDNHAADAAAGTFVDIDSRIDLAGYYGNARPDVAKALSNPLYTNSGFEIRIPSNALSKGSHDIALDIYARNGSGIYRDPKILTLDVH